MLPRDSAQSCMACLSYFIVHSPCTRDAPTYTNLEWLLRRILSFTVRAHATLRRIQNLNGLSIVFYRSHSAHTRRSDVYIDYRQVWGSLRLAPNRLLLTLDIDTPKMCIDASLVCITAHTHTHMYSVNAIHIGFLMRKTSVI